jgi:CheY-like chemotaxis protein
MPTGRKKIQILQVDDDPLFNTVCGQHFQQHGNVELTQVASIAAASEKLSLQPQTDILMLDLSLPDRDGFEYLKELSTIPFAGRLIIVSSQPPSVIDMAQTMAKGLDLNVAITVEKPLTPEKLAKIDEIVFSD